MSLDDIFRSAVSVLQTRGISFAVAGGLAADLYRSEPRLTMDVDLTISTEVSAELTAVSIIEELGLQAGVVRKADLDGGPVFAIRRGNTQPCIIVGRTPGTPSGPGVDILLPAIPWVLDAIGRAQANRVDFGFGAVPVLTLEDVMIAKLYALRATPPRAKDIDDLQSIFSSGQEWDAAYIDGQMRRFEITIPRSVAPFLPDRILKLSRSIARTHKARRK